MGQKKAGAVCPGRRENCMRIIGIVPGAKLFGSEDLYADQYLFVNGYPKRILANGGTPVGILSSDGYAAEDSLSLCDAFVFCGGARFYPYHFQVMEYAAKSGKPVLGICLGMQLLFEKSYEYGEHAGLGFIKGEVCPLGPDLADKSLKVPQMGWNALHIVKDDPLFRYIREGEYVYYVHSYYGKNCAESTLAVSDYSIPVTGAVRAGRVYGTQFHPEKSGDTGLRILKAFSEL